MYYILYNLFNKIILNICLFDVFSILSGYNLIIRNCHFPICLFWIDKQNNYYFYKVFILYILIKTLYIVNINYIYFIAILKYKLYKNININLLYYLKLFL